MTLVQKMRQLDPVRFDRMLEEELAQKELFPVDENILRYECANRVARRIEDELSDTARGRH